MLTTKHIYENDTNIFRLEISGKVTTIDLFNMYKDIFEKQVIPSHCKNFIIIDAGITEFPEEYDFDLFVKLKQEYLELLTGTRLAVCSENLQLLAFTFKFTKIAKEPVSRPFSSERRAYDWLNTPH